MKTYAKEALIVLTVFGMLIAAVIHIATSPRVPKFQNQPVELRE